MYYVRSEVRYEVSNLPTLLIFLRILGCFVIKPAQPLVATKTNDVCNQPQQHEKIYKYKT